MSGPIEFDREEDGRWIAEIPSLPGAMAYGASREEAEAKVQDLALERTRWSVDEGKTWHNASEGGPPPPPSVPFPLGKARDRDYPK